MLAIICPTTPSYTQEFVPDCSDGNEKILWPYYEDISLYYRCQGVGNPVLASCPYNMVFNFRSQACSGCNLYLAAPACSELLLASGKKPSCVTIPPTATTSAPATTRPTTATTPTPGPVANCPAIKAYTETFTPTCTGKDVNLLWPNYANPSEYYFCLGEGQPRLQTCVYKMYFNFHLQSCTNCDSYIPTPKCSELSSFSQGKIVCQKI